MNKPPAGNGTLVSNGAAPSLRAQRLDPIESLPPAPPLSLEEMREEVERALAEVEFPAPEGAERLAEAARYALLGGGKRVRPILVMAAAQAFGVPVGEVLPTACAIELIHTNSLIVDDLPAMEDDIAILAGCALLSEAQRLILADQPGSPHLRNRLLQAVLEATGTAGMVGGQFLDVTKYRPRDRDDLERLQMLKTGTLLVASVRCGTLIATDRTDPAFDSFAASLGSLFQVVDDILDETGKARWLGKIPGSDRLAGRMTHVTMFGLRQARETAKGLHERSLESLAEIDARVPGSTQPLREIADLVYRRKQ
ncbi:MAG: polyprenyl synthetase family protein [Actinobacteria bacterium]|nr:MAG: polyprenyl synthetase family protein [Actinomycetota bacterium]